MILYTPGLFHALKDRSRISQQDTLADVQGVPEKKHLSLSGSQIHMTIMDENCL